jgi:predicted phage terminase large subunit-like protein
MSQLNIRLLKWQQEVWKDTARFQVIAAGRRTGKSRIAAWKLLVKALQATEGTIFYVAPTQGQARDIMWKLLLELGHSVIKNVHVNNLEITLINGRQIRLKGADRPETMRGVSLYFVVLDEYADIRPDVWEQILRPALADLKGEAMFIGTPMGRNHFYDLFKEAGSDNDPDYKAWHYTSYDNETLDPKEIEAAKRSMSSYAFRQEFMASFEARGSEIFKEEWVKLGDDEQKSEGDYYIAIDLAGFAEVGAKRSKNTKLDQSAIAVVQVSEAGDWYIETIIRGRWDLGTTANKIFQAIRDYQPVAVGIEKGISRQAVMSPLSDLMRMHNKYFNVLELTHGNKKKTDRIVWALQGRFEHGRITVGDGEWREEFLDQLYQFPSELVHDDLVDAVAYVDQLVKIPYGIADFEQTDFEPLDPLSGY